MSSTIKRIFAITASAVWLPVFAGGFAGCGGKQSPEFDASDTSVALSELQSQAAAWGERGSRDAQQFAPQLLTAAAYLAEHASDSWDEASVRERLALADRYYRDAEEVARVVKQRRSLQFPSDRSLGNLSVAPWSTGVWRTYGDAQGVVEIEPETMVFLSADREFTTDDMAILAGFGPGAIQYLSVGDTGDARSMLEAVPKLIGLRDISIAGATAATDDDLATLATCYGLRHINLMTNGITDAGIERLSQLPALEEIAVQGEGITDRAAFLASRMPSLHSFMTRQTKVSDVGVEYLTNEKELRRLWLGGSAVTGHSVESLAEMGTLEELVLMQTSIRLDELRTLREALPRCDVDTTY